MILITGASRGIGKFLFEKFAGMKNSDEKVFGTYFNDNDLLSGDKNFFKIDITRYDDLEKLSERLKPEIKNLILINCAGNNYNCFAHKSSPGRFVSITLLHCTGEDLCGKQF